MHVHDRYTCAQQSFIANYPTRSVVAKTHDKHNSIGIIDTNCIVYVYAANEIDAAMMMINDNYNLFHTMRIISEHDL